MSNDIRIDERFTDWLKAEFLNRQSKNPRFGLRAFARFLDVDPSNLSKILRGKRKVGALAQKRLIERLERSTTATQEIKEEAHV